MSELFQQILSRGTPSEIAGFMAFMVVLSGFACYAIYEFFGLGRR